MILVVWGWLAVPAGSETFTWRRPPNDTKTLTDTVIVSQHAMLA